MGLKPILRTTTSFSALTLSVGSFDPYKPVPDMTYNVFGGTLNPNQSINLSGWKVVPQLRTSSRETPVAKFIVCSWHEQLPDVVGMRPASDRR